MKEWGKKCARLQEPGLGTADILERLVTLAGEVGFEYVSYCVQTVLPLATPRSFMLSNATPDMRAAVLRQHGVRLLPTASHVQQSAALLFWPLDKCPADMFYRDMKACGVKGAWTMAASNRVGMIGRLSACRVSGPITEADVAATAMFWKLTECVDAAVRPMVQADLMQGQPQPQVDLTPFERSVLAWAADGKSAWETALILNVDEQSILYHRRTIKEKMGGANLTDCIVKAMALGILGVPPELELA